MIKLRPYQIEAVNAIKEHFKKEDGQYIELPTGSGKTVTFLTYAKEYSKRVLIVVPSRELLKQVYETSLSFYEKKDISRKGADFDEYPSKLHICIINSIRGKYLEFISEQYFDLLIIDEAHHVHSNSYIKMVWSFKKLFAPKILGVTATPDRLDGKLIKELLGTCTFKKGVYELIVDGYLSDIEGYAVKTKIDLSEIDSHNGDFSLSQLFKKLCTESRNNLIRDLCRNEMKDRKTLIFCINIEHSKMICKVLQDVGLSCAHIDGKMNAIQRSAILSSFRNGEISYLTNCQLLTEGFDEPSIDGIILARPTKSRALFNQMIGRGLRINQGKKNCKIIDVVDNHKNLQGFNSLLCEEKFPEIGSFSSIKDIGIHLGKEQLKVTEFSIERTDLINKDLFFEKEATTSMLNYLNDNEIIYFQPITLDEGSFLIWMNELKKELIHGHNN